MSDLATPERLPCGCQMGTQVIDGVRSFVFRPCSEDCTYYAYVITESRKQGKAIETRHVQ